MRLPAERFEDARGAAEISRSSGGTIIDRGLTESGWGRGRARRSVVEWGLHAAAAALLAWALVRSLGQRAPDGAAATNARLLRTALATWTTSAAPTSVHATLDSVPSPVDRDWLAALPGAGTRVTWSDDGLTPLAVDAEPVADPEGATRVRVAVPSGTAVMMSDRGGVLDTLVRQSRGARPTLGATMTLPEANSDVDVLAGNGRTAARAVVGDSLLFKRVLVLGRVGWESRFVVDALEQRGWRVDAHLALAPGNDIRQGVGEGRRLAIDTARYAAVVVLDSSVTWATVRLLGYARSGGGVVLAGTAADIMGLRPIVSGIPGAVLGDGPLTPRDSAPPDVRAALGLIPILGLTADAVSLDRRGGGGGGGGGGVIAQAARRIGLGRVMQVGYTDTWRWRMIAADGVRAHRDWWAGIVSSVAYAPAVRRWDRPASDPAPLLGLGAALGPPTAATNERPPTDEARWREWMVAAALGALLLEWASRRLRGAR